MQLIATIDDMQSREGPGGSVRGRIDDANPEAPAVETAIASEESVSLVRGVSADHKGPDALIFRTRHGCGLGYRRVGDVFHPYCRVRGRLSRSDAGFALIGRALRKRGRQQTA